MPCPEGHRCSQMYFSDILALRAHVVVGGQTEALQNLCELQVRSSFMELSLRYYCIRWISQAQFGTSRWCDRKSKGAIEEKQALWPDKACRKPQAMRRGTWEIVLALCVCILLSSEYGAWHRVGVCGLEEAVFQLTDTGFSYKWACSWSQK